MKDYKKKLITYAKDNVKYRKYFSSEKVQKVSLYLKNEECFIRETLHPYLKCKGQLERKKSLSKKKQLTNKFNNIRDQYSLCSN